MELIPAQRASTLITAREPLKQAAGVEQVLACLAAFIRHLLVRRDDRVADGAFCLAFQRAGNVAAESSETVYD